MKVEEMKVDKFVVLKEKLARKIFKELGDVEGLSRFDGLTKLEKIISETLNLGDKNTS